MPRDLPRSVYPEIAFGGFSRVDGTVQFYARIQALLPESGVVLDVGCGRGRASEDPCEYRRRLCDLRAPGRRVIGIDVDSRGVENPLVDDFRKIDDVDHWPVADASVDVAVANSVVEHVARPKQFFAEAWRVLKPGGLLCFRTYNKWGYVGVCARLTPNRYHSKVTSFAQTDREEHDVFPTVYRCNTPRAVRRALVAQGFESCVYTLEAEPSYLSFSSVLYRLGSRLHRMIPPGLRWTILAFARKPAAAQSAQRASSAAG
ncbi:MAG: class I SAM-dependent methyltransferase [Pirellulales bacterium]|nr:class I SAM-dependent methyltransferase [Pirellulales bacterium]